MDIVQLFSAYAATMHKIEEMRQEFPQLAQAEKEADELKKQIQEYAKENGEADGYGYQVKLSARASWDGKKLDGYAAAHPELYAFKSETVVATVKKQK